MRVLITGVACVGKTTIGEKLAAILGCPFFDLDVEIERYFGTSIERLRNRYLTAYSYRKEASNALKKLLLQPESKNCVIAITPSGLMDSYWRIVKKANAVTVVLEDTADNILSRITFYDIDSKPIEKKLSDKEKELYRDEIIKDIRYYKRPYKRANHSVVISGLDADEAARKVQRAILASKSTENKIITPTGKNRSKR